MKSFDPEATVWPINVVPEHPQLKLGDVFTMEVPCDPETGLFSSLECGGVLMKRMFKVVKEESASKFGV